MRQITFKPLAQTRKLFKTRPGQTTPRVSEPVQQTSSSWKSILVVIQVTVTHQPKLSKWQERLDRWRSWSSNYSSTPLTRLTKVQWQLDAPQSMFVHCFQLMLCGPYTSRSAMKVHPITTKQEASPSNQRKTSKITKTHCRPKGTEPTKWGPKGMWLSHRTTCQSGMEICYKNTLKMWNRSETLGRPWACLSTSSRLSNSFILERVDKRWAGSARKQRQYRDQVKNTSLTRIFSNEEKKKHAT